MQVGDRVHQALSFFVVVLVAARAPHPPDRCDGGRVAIGWKWGTAAVNHVARSLLFGLFAWSTDLVGVKYLYAQSKVEVLCAIERGGGRIFAIA